VSDATIADAFWMISLRRQTLASSSYGVIRD
jgi:hypothetical protein